MLLFAVVFFWNLSLRREVSVRRDIEQKMRFMATHDDSTKLANRSLLMERLSQAILQHARHQEKLALLFVDLDGFKAVNDQYGHDVGDQVLVKVASLIKQTLRQSDVVARLGGEEFVILLPMATEEQAWHTAERLRQQIAALHWPSPVTAHYRQTVSVGLSLQTADYDIERQLQQADQALYQAKQAGRDGIQWFVAESVS